MSSLKMTFSLTSLIFLIALGLVFAPTSVMAHSDTQRTAADPDVGPHTTHPVNVATEADPDADPPVLGIPSHGVHPEPTITLKQVAGTTRGNEVVIVADDTATSDIVENAFTVEIEFDVDVAAAATATEKASIVTSLAASDFNIITENAKGVRISGNDAATIADATVIANTDKYMAVITLPAASLPTAESGKDLEYVMVKVVLQESKGFSLQKAYVNPTTLAQSDVPGGATLQSNIAEFKLVKSLTGASKQMLTLSGIPTDNTITTLDPFNVMIKRLDSDGMSMAFDLANDDIEVMGATFLLGPDAMKKTYTLAVTPKTDLAADGEIVISAADTSDYRFDDVTITYKPVKPVATITSDAYHMGKRFAVTVTVPSEGLATNFMLAKTDLMITPAAATIVGIEPIADPPTGKKSWTVYIEPFNPSETRTLSVTVSATGKLAAATGTDGTASVKAMPDAPAAPADLTATAGEEKVTLKWTVAAGASYQYRKKSGTATFKADGSDYMDIAATALKAVTGSTTMKMFEVTGLTGGTAYTFEVRVKADATTSTPAGAAATAIATPTAAPRLATDDTRDNVTSETEYPLSTMLAPGGFVVIAPMNRTDIDGAEIVITELPNLQRFFAKGGTISLMGGTSDAGTINKSVVITEIMWGLNTAAALGSQANYQWIELYNTDNKNADLKADTTGATVDLSGYKLVFTPGTTLPKPANLSDQVSNVELGGWDVDIGQNGSLGAKTETFTPVRMISMYRNFKYADLTKVHNKDKADENRKGQLGVIPSGSVRGSWAASTISDTYAANQLGSPGTEHFVGRDTFDATSVGRNAVVITEVGNNSNDAYDWIELTAIADAGLKDYELQYIEGQNVTVLAQFVEKTLKAGEILLVLQSNPRNNSDHPVAAGKEWKLADADRDNTGTKSLYHVDSRLKIPNDKGKALFVLRNAKDKKNHENIVDLAGNSFVTDNSSAYRTKLWPLRATAAGHGNVIDGDVEDFNSGRVYQRNDRVSGIGEKDWSVRGYTGIGYKRSAANNGQNGGTPGFDNGALKEKDGDLAGDSAVTISEIMYDRGSRENLVQWIELHNSSMTQAVNLNEWKLKIENANDVDVRRPAVTIGNLGGTIIPPNQTVLIVAYVTGRHSRGSQGNVDFPAQRIINLSGKGELEIPEGVNKRNYRLLSETAFKLTLTEKGGGTVDTVGNLGADGTAMWELPETDNGGRSSIIRRYNTGKTTRGGMMAATGTLPVWSGQGALKGAAGDAGWILAASSHLTEVRVNETYYGNPDDIGTPGYRGGGPLPVSLSKFRPERLKDTGEIVVRWVTESELNNAGFNILRSEKRDSGFTKIHFEAGEGTTSERTVYEWKDTSAKPNVVYYYQIQDVSLDGEVTTLRTTHLRGNVTAVGKATTTWGEIKALQ